MDFAITSGVVQRCPSDVPMLMRISFMLREYIYTVLYYMSTCTPVCTCTLNMMGNLYTFVLYSYLTCIHTVHVHVSTHTLDHRILSGQNTPTAVLHPSSSTSALPRGNNALTPYSLILSEKIQPLRSDSPPDQQQSPAPAGPATTLQHHRCVQATVFTL